MASVGIRLGPYVRKGLLQFEAVRPNYHGLEGHLLGLHGTVDRFRPEAVIIDPITGLSNLGNANDIGVMLTRIIGHFSRTSASPPVFTSLTGADEPVRAERGRRLLAHGHLDPPAHGRIGRRRHRRLYRLKSRGMAHSTGCGSSC